jgi:hypothetical protein
VANDRPLEKEWMMRGEEPRRNQGEHSTQGTVPGKV